MKIVLLCMSYFLSLNLVLSIIVSILSNGNPESEVKVIHGVCFVSYGNIFCNLQRYCFQSYLLMK